MKRVKKNKFTSIITGDIVNSSNESPVIWLKALKKILRRFGKEPKNWEVFRGDMFQLEVEPQIALNAAFLIKATIKQIKDLDVRMAIGIGHKGYNNKRISQSNGDAFVLSGQLFEKLNKKRLSILISSAGNNVVTNFNKDIQLYIKLASLTMDNWAPKTAQIMKSALENPDLNQSKLAKKLKTSQSNISAALNRAGYYELKSLEKRYIELLNEHIGST